MEKEQTTSVIKKNISKTFLRTEKTMDKYVKYTQQIAKQKNPINPFDDIEQRALKKFNHWLIIKNDFPYDAIASKSDLLFTRRKTPFLWNNLTQKEREELEEIKKEYLKKEYNSLTENLPRGQTAPGHFHLQLLKLLPEKIFSYDIENIEKKIIKEFNNWMIVDNNEFDKESEEINHLLLLKNDNVSNEALKELEKLKNGYFAKHYDLLREFLLNRKENFYLQLVILKREEVV